MEPNRNDRAQERLAGRCAELGLADPREAYRRLLVDLKARDADGFAQATSHYREHVLPALMGAEDPVETWIDYGRVLGEMAGAGSLYAIDATGRAFPHRAPVPPGALVVYLMDAGTRGSFVAVRPAALTAAQEATIGLLVEARLAL